MLKIALQHVMCRTCGSALNSLGVRFDGHPVEVNLLPDLPGSNGICADCKGVDNLLEKAIKYSPEGQPIEVYAE